MEELIGHIDALNLLFEALAGSLTPPDGHERCQKRFPDEDNWYWVRIASWGEDRVESPAALSWLNARWTIVERAFQSFTVLRPRIRRAREQGEVRGLEAFEWSCIGLHRLWDGWAHPQGVIHADLRPALFSFDTEDSPEENLDAYELFYAQEGVEAMARELRESAAGNGPEDSQQRDTDVDDQPSNLWLGVLKSCVERQRLLPSSKPMALLSALKSEGLARKQGGQVAIKLDDGEVTVSIAEFQKGARQALDASG